VIHSRRPCILWHSTKPSPKSSLNSKTVKLRSLSSMIPTSSRRLNAYRRMTLWRVEHVRVRLHEKEKPASGMQLGKNHRASPLWAATRMRMFGLATITPRAPRDHSPRFPTWIPLACSGQPLNPVLEGISGVSTKSREKVRPKDFSRLKSLAAGAWLPRCRGRPLKTESLKEPLPPPLNTHK